MNFTAAMSELRTAGTAQNRKIYARHGVQGRMFGVSYAVLGKLAKSIKTDHALACRLWASGNHDARVLATMVADPAQVDHKLADAWVKDLDNYALTDALGGLVGQSRLARRKADKWIRSKHEWIARAGWNLVAHLALRDNEVEDEYFADRVPTIVETIHDQPNRTRDAMNGALIAIGVRNDRLCKLALAAAKKIGKVEVDHGETNCKTPDAAAYIKNTLNHRWRKKRRVKAKCGR